MIKKIKIELIYFFSILLVLSLLQHSDLLNSPMQRASLMMEQGNFLHPLLWTSLVYVIVLALRTAVKFLFYIKNRNKTNKS